jgi:hypothetical protein
MLAWVITAGQVMIDSTDPRFSHNDHGRCCEGKARKKKGKMDQRK